MIPTPNQVMIFIRQARQVKSFNPLVNLVKETIRLVFSNLDAVELSDQATSTSNKMLPVCFKMFHLKKRIDQ